MTVKPEDVGLLLEEYRTIAAEALGHADFGGRHKQEKRLVRELVTTGEWTPEAATHLTRLAHEYGTFMLRNALALAIALDIEDGELGY